MKRVLIFGCSGFVGKYLCEEFSKHGYNVIGTMHLEKFDYNTLKYLSNLTRVEITDFNSVINCISTSQPDFIINLSAISSVKLSWEIPQETMNINVTGTLNILEAVRKLNIRPKILLIGSSEEYAISSNKISELYQINANNPYGISKVTQECLATLYRNKYNMNIINTRTFNHTGIGQSDRFVIPSFVKQVAKIHNSHNQGIISVGNLNVNRDIGDIRDMVSAYRMILESDTEENVFNVGSGECYNLGKLLQYIISLSSEKIRVNIDPQKLRPADNPIIWCDNSLIKETVGWEPQYTVYDAIDNMFYHLTK